jgi:hypothetical protein
MPHARDPVSESFDAAAAKLLGRAHGRPRLWVGTYVANPDRAWERYARSAGMGRLLGPDPQPGGLARTRWVRGFVRSLYYLHKHYYYEGRGLDLGEKRNVPNTSRALEFEVGRVRLDRGGVIRGRAVRIRLREGGSEALAAVQELPDSARIFDDAGRPAGRWADPARRDW